ncbi:hypothetical protein [Lunatimonas salinarum]|uniref:hypothetical protein n=1 Tax=Lunatimonas salinarum TaxID=1774590 RepID=UPI001AE0BC19|nr:hypothetical protein [Lunatimonas salinarum]
MNRILNLICPTSHLEHFITKKTYHENVVNYYVTSLGLGLHLHKQDQAEQLRTTLERLNIEEIRLFQDVNCPFIQNVIDRSRPCEFFIDQVLEEIYSQEVSYTDFEKADYQNKAKKIAERNLIRQMETLQQHTTLSSYIEQRNMALKGLIVNKAENAVVKEIEYSPRYLA